MATSEVHVRVVLSLKHSFINTYSMFGACNFKQNGNWYHVFLIIAMIVLKLVLFIQKWLTMTKPE